MLKTARALLVSAALVLLVTGPGCSRPATPATPPSTAAPAGTGAFADAPAAQVSRDMLDQFVPEISADHKAFEAVLASIQAQTQVNMHVNWKALEAAQVTRATEVTAQLKNIPLRKGLSIVLAEASPLSDLDFMVNAGVLEISTSEDMESARYVFSRIYDVRDLIAADIANALPPVRQRLAELNHQVLEPDPEVSMTNLMTVIIAVVRPDSWRQVSGGPGTITSFNGHLIITQSPRGHDAIAALLANLGDRGAAAPAAPQPRAAPADPTLRLILDQPVTDLSAEEQPLEIFLNTLRDKMHVTVLVNWPALEATGVTRNSPVTIRANGAPLRQVLRNVLLNADRNTGDLGFLIDEGVLQISSTADLHREKYLSVRVYDVWDILGIGSRAAPSKSTTGDPFAAPPPPATADALLFKQDQSERLVDAITSVIAPETWRENMGDSALGSIRAIDGQLVIKQTADVHTQITDLLAQLRTAPAAPKN